MSLFNRIFNRAQTQPAPVDDVMSWLPTRYIPVGLNMSLTEQLSLSAVYGCMRVISEALASSPWNVYQREEKRRELLPDDKVSYALNLRPNDEVTAQSFREAQVFQALAHGNSYAEIVLDEANRFYELKLLDSEKVTPGRNQKGELVYEIAEPDGSKVIVPSGLIFHLRALSSVYGLLGDSVVTRAAKAIANAHASERFALNYYSSNATVGGILKVPRALKPDEQASLESGFTSDHGGVQKAFKTLALPPGTEFMPISHDAEKAQVLPARQFSVEEIIRYFGVPPHLVGVAVASQGYGRNLAELGLTFTRHTLTPWKKRLEQEANFKLFPQKKPWKFTEIDLTWLTLGDAKTVADTFGVYLDKGVYSVNEVREKLGENDIGPDGDARKGTGASEPTGGGETPSDDSNDSEGTPEGEGTAPEGGMGGPMMGGDTE